MELFSYTTYPIGIDISDRYIKIAQLKKMGDRVKIQALGKIELGTGIVRDGEIADQAAFIKSLKTLIDNPQFGRIDGNEIVTCLPETKTFLKLIEIEKTPNNLANIMPAEIEKHIPMSIDEMYFDWQLMENHLDKQIILFAAAPKKIVDQYTAVFNEAKLATVALEAEAISICRAILKEEGPKYKPAGAGQSYGIIDIGYRKTGFSVYANRTLLFTLSLPISGDEITESIAKTLGIEIVQAEKAKIICGLDKNKAKGIIKNILSDVIDRLIIKIKEAVDYYGTHFPNYGPLNEIILCGGGAHIRDLNRIIMEHVSAPVVLADISINISETRDNLAKIFSEKHTLNIDLADNKGDDQLSVIQDSSLAYATAIGLALRGIFIDDF